MKILITFFLMLSCQLMLAQDSLHATKPFEMYWTKPRFVPRVGIAVQESTSVEAGIGYHKIYVHPLALASAGPYLNVEAIWRQSDFVFGPKLGYEFTVGVLGIAADATYYTDSHKGSWMFTPKAGLSLMGFANIFYGRNILMSTESFGYISQNRFSIVFNLNKDYFNLKNAPRK